MKTQQEVNNFFQENTVHVSAIYQIVQYLKDFNLKLPNNVILHEKGIGQTDFFKWFENQTNSLNKNKYPDSVLKCEATLGFKEIFSVVRNVPFKYYSLLGNFGKLLICRDAYWKIAGEEMGLGKPWKPDWGYETTKHAICTYKNTIVKNNAIHANSILVFPTEEMRNTFYEHFKDLIEQCKELL
jgi:hypothetical protein